MKSIRYLMLLFVVLQASSCEKEVPDPEVCEYTVVNVTSNIVSDTSWSEGNVYVIDMDEFQVESILNIEPGTIIKFREGASMTVKPGGKINCNGISAKPVIFTSLRDDDHGCDTNEDGSATRPAAANWGKILLENESSVFSYCHFLYGGGSTLPTTLEAAGVRVQIHNCVFAQNTGGIYDGSYYGALDLSKAKDNSYIKNNGFYNNYLPLTTRTGINLGRDHYFSNPDNAADKNTLMGIFLQGDIDQNVSLAETEVPYVILNPSLQVKHTFNLNDSVIVKMPEGGSITIYDGGVLFYPEEVIFTSFKDDLSGGDTNGDGNNSVPQKGDWIGIYDTRIPGEEFYVPGPNIRYSEFP